MTARARFLQSDLDRAAKAAVKIGARVRIVATGEIIIEPMGETTEPATIADPFKEAIRNAKRQSRG